MGAHRFVAAALQRDAAAHLATLLGLHLRLDGAAAALGLFLKRISVVVQNGSVIHRIRAAQVADGRDEAAFLIRDICLDRVLTGVDVAALRVNALWVEGRRWQTQAVINSARARSRHRVSEHPCQIPSKIKALHSLMQT